MILNWGHFIAPDLLADKSCHHLSERLCRFLCVIMLLTRVLPKRSSKFIL